MSPQTNRMTDIYSYGMILFELASRKVPYAEVPDIVYVDLVRKGERETIPEGTPLLFKELIEKCWHHDPKQRPLINEVIGLLDKVKV
jgi:serine/threonine protein kinase